jgi:hypothetical protein
MANKLIPFDGLVESNPRGFRIFCPGCKYHHYLPIKKYSNMDEIFEWNSNSDKPTFKPELLIKGYAGNMGTPKCHSRITDGMIEFFIDCTHELAGKTVELPDADKNTNY